MLMQDRQIRAGKACRTKRPEGRRGTGVTARFQHAMRQGRRRAARYTPNSTELCLPISDRSGTLLFIIGDLITI